MRYLLVTHIPFARNQEGSALLDGLWAEDLRGLAANVGSVTVAAPQLSPQDLQSWGPATVTVSRDEPIHFVGLPPRRGRLDLLSVVRSRKILATAVSQADLVHTSNLFRPNLNLYYGHDLAVRLGKKTLFVVAEDFYDMQMWEWIRTEKNGFRRRRGLRMLGQLHEAVCARVRTSSLTFLHTPAAVARYREFACNAVAIRQPMHEREDVIELSQFEEKCAALRQNVPLVVCAACRMETLKGVDFIVRAVAILKERGIAVRAMLYGGGREAASFAALAERLGVSDCVIFPGALSPARVLREALAEGHIFLMPHLTSDFGRAFFDGLCAGNPVIAFRSIASVDTVRHEVDGLIAANADDESLADCIARLHRDRVLLVRMAREARSRAMSNTRTFWNGYRAKLIHGLFDSGS